MLQNQKYEKKIGIQNCIFDSILKKVIWKKNGEIPSPELMFRRLTAFVATTPKIATHISGSAIDISVYQASNISKLDRGAAYFKISESTFMDSPFISEEAAKNRLEINKILKKHGFIACPFDFWHFSQGDIYSEYLTNSANDARYGVIHFDLSSGQIVPLDKLKKPLYSMEQIQTKIKSSLTRIT